MQGPENPWPEPQVVPEQPAQQGVMAEGAQQAPNTLPQVFSTPDSFTPLSPIPSPTGELTGGVWSAGMSANDSGMGAQSVLPDELKGFNVGAFFLTWIWSIGHQFWLGLLVLPLGVVLRMTSMPKSISLLINLGVMIGFGIMGNQWAWQNRKWNSTQHFRDTERVWKIWGIALFVIGLLFILLIFMVAGAFLMAALRGASTTTMPSQFPSR